MEERNKRQYFTGIVTSDKMDKTIVVEIDTSRKHPIYGKRIKFSTKIKAHDEKNEANIGDKVTIVSTRPLSKDKSFRLEKIVEKSKNNGVK